MALPTRFLLATAIVVPAVFTSTSAHFRLLEPAPWISTNDLGDPQKVGPCGGDPQGQNDKLVTGVITKVVGGRTCM